MMIIYWHEQEAVRGRVSRRQDLGVRFDVPLAWYVARVVEWHNWLGSYCLRSLAGAPQSQVGVSTLTDYQQEYRAQLP